MTAIGDALFTKTRQKVLGLLYGKPENSFYTNEIVRWAGMGRGTVRRELQRLSEAGLITAQRAGNQLHYQANAQNPVFSELMGIVRKTFGIIDVIRTALIPIDAQVEQAFVYGSLPKGEDNEKSDIDLMLIGHDLNYGDVMSLLIPLEESLKRSVNPTIYNPEDFRIKLEEGSSFLTRVLQQQKWMVKGGFDDIGESGQDQKAYPAQHVESFSVELL